ncbi:hypothetical protein HOB96_01225 [bacterium]|nr:hypothetical protein [bacterium]
MRNLLERNIIYINLFFAIIAALLLDRFPKYFSFTTYFDFPLLDYLAACFFLFILGLAISYLLLKSGSSFLNSPNLAQPLSALCVCLFLFLVIYHIDWTFYHKWQPYKAVIYKEITTYLLALILFGAILSYSYLNKSTKKSLNYACIAALILLCAYMAYFLIFNEWHRYNENTINFQVVLNPIVQAYLGKAVFINQVGNYGGYAYFFEPILKMTGLSILTVSSLFSFFLFSTLALGAYALYQIVENKILLVFGFIAYLFFHFFWASLWPYELYLQYYPIRTVFPALSIFLAAYYFKKPSLKLYIFSITVLTLGIIWSIDVGPFALCAFIVAKLFHMVCDKGLSSNEKIKKIIYYLAYSIITILSVFILFALYTKLRYGVFIDYSNMLTILNRHLAQHSTANTQHIGGRGGLPLDRPLVIVLISYLIVLIYSGLNILKQRKDYKNTLTFLIAILGLGLFTYQLNNSTTQLIAQCGYLFVFLLIIFADTSLKHIEGKNFSTYGYKAFAVFSVFLISFATVVFFLNIQRNHITTQYVRIHEFYPKIKPSDKDVWTTQGHVNHKKKLGYKTTGYVKMKDIAGDNPLNLLPPWMQHAEDLQNFFKKEEVDLKGKKVVIFSMWDGYLHLKLKVPSAISVANAFHTYYVFQNVHDKPRLEKELYDGIKNREFDWIIMDTHRLLMLSPDKYNYPIIRKLLTASNYTLMVLPTADTWYDGWNKDVLLIYTKSKKGNCAIVSETSAKHPEPINGIVEWKCK